ncbi:MAG: glycosyltransferase family 2 protein [Chitinophagaceae bacterium]|nr:MAG: glycosyltransferase family 2 protein [Chitinophagaceae bacterium]
MTAAALFWFLLAGVFFAYVGYPLLLLALTAFRRRRDLPVPEQWPELTLVVAAYNEAAILPEKIRNALALDYPAGRLHLLVVTDGSTDGSADLLATFAGVEVLHQDQRRGKTAALNRALAAVRTPLVVLSDANTELAPGALKLLLRHFENERVGAVAGEKRVRHSSGMGFAEGWYWHYESFVKRLDARLYSVVGAAGELFALRTALFRPMPEDTLLDDLALSLHIGLQGRRIAYEPGAYALEAPSASLRDEQTRKVRIAAGAFQLLERLPWRNLLGHPLLAFQFVARRWLRWVFCPPALPLLLLLNAALSVWHGAPLYDWLLGGQLLAYTLAAAGAGLLRRNRAFFLTTVPFYFLFMNACLLAGWWKYRKGRQSVLWEKAR